MKLSSASLGIFAFLSSATPIVAQPRQTSKPVVVIPSAPIEPGALNFELRLPAGKTSFQQGETIKVQLLFSSSGSQKLWFNTSWFPRGVRFALFNAEPQKNLPEEPFFSYNGPPPPPPKMLGEKPIEQTEILNETLRFDSPGTYQICAITNQVLATAQGQPSPRSGSLFGSNTLVTSRPLTLHIVPADPTWQQEQVEEWRAFWAKQKSLDYGIGWITPPGVLPPSNDLRYLNTRASAHAIIERLAQDHFPRSSGSEAYFWRSGVARFPERLWLINAMKDAIKRPDYAVSQGLLQNLAMLQGLYHVSVGGGPISSDQTAEVEAKAEVANWKLAFDALASKRGYARALTVHSLLETAWLSRLTKTAEVQRQLPRLVALVPDIFSDLPSLPQQYLLDDRNDKYAPGKWQQVKSPRFVAPLLRAWKTVPHARGWEMERGNLILRHLYELDPKAARPLILQEMASPNPRVSFEVLSLPNDKFLPQLQNIWWEHMTSNGPDHDMAALLIGRYATPALKLEVQREYTQRKHHNMLSSDVKRGLQQYLTRVGAL